MARKRPSMTMIAASALSHMPIVDRHGVPVVDGYGRLVPMFTIDELRTITPKEFVSRFDMDHAIYEAWQGPHAFWNYTPRLREDRKGAEGHKTKTKRDIKEIARVRRRVKKRAKEAAALADEMLAATAKEPKAKRSWPKREFPKGPTLKQQRERYAARHRSA